MPLNVAKDWSDRTLKLIRSAVDGARILVLNIALVLLKQLDLAGLIGDPESRTSLGLAHSHDCSAASLPCGQEFRLPGFGVVAPREPGFHGDVRIW